jgi:hypothetical protein
MRHTFAVSPPVTCCGSTCQRRATSEIRAPGTSVCLMTAAFSAADQRRRRTDPTGTAIRRSSRFASSLPSNITIAQSSSLLQAKQTPRSLPLKKGVRAPLTVRLSRDAKDKLRLWSSTQRRQPGSGMVTSRQTGMCHACLSQSGCHHCQLAGHLSRTAAAHCVSG